MFESESNACKGRQTLQIKILTNIATRLESSGCAKMANKISPLEEAMPDLIKLPDQSTPVQVVVAFPNGGATLLGILTSVDLSSLNISASLDLRGASLHLTNLSDWSFSGEFEELEYGIYLLDGLFRKDEPGNMKSVGIHIEAKTAPGESAGLVYTNPQNWVRRTYFDLRQNLAVTG
jgi:hypothetical protein